MCSKAVQHDCLRYGAGAGPAFNGDPRHHIGALAWHCLAWFVKIKMPLLQCAVSGMSGLQSLQQWCDENEPAQGPRERFKEKSRFLFRTSGSRFSQSAFSDLSTRSQGLPDVCQHRPCRHGGARSLHAAWALGWLLPPPSNSLPCLIEISLPEWISKGRGQMMGG